MPITAQSLGVMLAGAVLGARRGFASLVLLLVLVAVGLPLLAGGRGGLGVFATPSVGFLLGCPSAAYVVGWLTERGGSTYRLPWGIVANVLGGDRRALRARHRRDRPGRRVSRCRPRPCPTWVFLPGDLVKAVVAALVARGVHAAYPGPARSAAPPPTRSGTRCLTRSRTFLAAHEAGEPVRLGTSGTSGSARAVVRTTDSWVVLVRRRLPADRADRGLASLGAGAAAPPR